ncbi:RNA polymerase sigma-54 factor [Bacteroidia bacterium]|nr:RNA polymerase sigma-54 factor [Bacteroidia bacterium]
MLKQSINIRQQQKLSPQQIQLTSLLQLPLMELEQRIKQEIEENPALEELANEETSTNDLSEDPDETVRIENTNLSRDSSDFDINDYLDEDDIASYKLRSDNYTEKPENTFYALSQENTLFDYLLSQLRLSTLSSTDLVIGKTIIGNLDADGYLKRTPEQITNDLAFTNSITTSVHHVTEILAIIQTFDPSGIAARNLKECLLLQLRHKTQTPQITCAEAILERMFDYFVNKRYTLIQNRLKIDEQKLSEAIDEITKLNPKPGSSYAGQSRPISQSVFPDFFVHYSNDQLQITLNQRNSPSLSINRQYADLLQTYTQTKHKTQEQTDTAMFVKQKIDSAKFFVEAMKMRYDTLQLVIHALVKVQSNYFKTGDIATLKPLTQQEIADLTQRDISTISRVVNSKYVETDFGILPLSSFFSTGVATQDGGETSATQVKDLIAQYIAAEDKRHPLNDDTIQHMLSANGITLSRRTIAKYREQINIPVARLRRSLTN